MLTNAKYNYIILISVFSFFGSAISAQSPVAGARDLSEIEELAEKAYPKFLISSSGRRDLPLIVMAVLFQRISSNTNGYEQDPLFLKDLNETYEAFLIQLNRDPYDAERAFRAQTPFAIKEEAALALRANSFAFEEFYRRISSKNPVLGSRSLMGGRSKDEITQAMLAFSILVYSYDSDLWKKAKARSHFWPVCRRREPGS